MQSQNRKRVISKQQVCNFKINDSLFENMIIAEFVKRMHHKDEINDIWFWRDSKGNEVDLLFREVNTLCITEIKANQTIMTNQFKGLLYFEKYAKNKNILKQLVYAGDDNQDRKIGKVFAWKDFRV